MPRNRVAKTLAKSKSPNTNQVVLQIYAVMVDLHASPNWFESFDLVIHQYNMKRVDFKAIFKQQQVAERPIDPALRAVADQYDSNAYAKPWFRVHPGHVHAGHVHAGLPLSLYVSQRAFVACVDIRPASISKGGSFRAGNTGSARV